MPKGLAGLEAFSLQSPVLGGTEVANRVNLHKTTGSRILNGLSETSYIRRDGQTVRFRVGLGPIRLPGPLLWPTWTSGRAALRGRRRKASTVLRKIHHSSGRSQARGRGSLRSQRRGTQSRERMAGLSVHGRI
ncbi:helix-turn-helix domain-containing protein [Paeniglutamicibacter gangotriensis]|uniref:Helix-turn-helix domain-containing protein n=1 Tax=Paeniglutamicibacter gangotriensis TaxID=254787 RepID=A0A5B0ECD1_9MICC|nr:helix-turn-helix domain-containing protein [Paeniglutamicibacter gangotriensis]KAA0975982.1 helix-turn-helix domain-containing protein [Paeniglutamicibacter gangotriensis]